MDFLQNIKVFLSSNKTWIFDGVGTNLISVFFGWIISHFSYEKGQKNCLERIIRMQNLNIDFNKFINLTVAASGSEYTAPADGCFNIYGAGNIKIYIDGICLQSIENGVVSQNVIKGQKVKIIYEKSLDSVKFYYAKELM